MASSPRNVAGMSGSPSSSAIPKGRNMNGGSDKTEQTRKHKQIIASSDEDDDVPLTKRMKPSGVNGKPSLENGGAGRRAAGAEEAPESDDSDVPLTRQSKPSQRTDRKPASAEKTGSSRGAKSVKREASDGDSDDEPLGKSSGISTTSASTLTSSSIKQHNRRSDLQPASKKAKIESESPEPDENGDEDNDDDDGEDAEEGDGDDDDDDDESTTNGKGKGSGSGVKHSGDGSKMWETLWHTGPRFPPAYQRLPSDVKMKYNGKVVELSPEAEEAALFYAVKLETPYVKDPVFNSNFFKDFQTVLKKHPPVDGTKVTDFKKCDFTQMCEHQKELKEAEKERKKKLAPSARKKEQQAKKEAEEEMKTCIVDGNKQRVGNVMVEPPALFMGRGQHPKRGQIKPRVRPEEITINHTLKDPKHPPPAAPAGHRWKAVVEMKDVTWLAHWIDFNGNYKYVYLDASSSFKSNSDREKFEKARKLDRCVKKLRQRVDEMLISKSRQERQLGTVIWLIDNYSLRAGNEKGEDEAATYGVCSLLVEHVKELVDEENKVQLEFLGKDSMLFKETLEVPERIFKNIKMFTRSTKDAKGKIAVKKSTDAIFERIDTSHVNKFLRDPKEGGMPGLSAKVFRTYNASTTFQGLLNRTADNLRERGLEPTPQSLKDEYMQANRLVAILCNHQKTINPQVAERQVARANEKMIALKYDIHKERQKILTVHKSVKDVKKEYPAKEYKDFDWGKFLEEDLELTEDQIKEHEERTITGKITRMEAAFERQELEREYQLEQARSGKSDKVSARKDVRKKQSKVESEDEDDKKGVVGKYKSREDVEEEKRRLQESLKVLDKERKTGKSQLEAESIKVETCARKIKQKFEAIGKFVADLESKNKTSDVSLGTSKINYVDPRVTVSFLKHWDRILVQKDEKAAGTKAGSKVKQEAASSADDKKKVKKQDSGDDKLDLGLQKLPIGQYFPAALQKKFKWADTDDSTTGRLPSSWVFVPDAEHKVRTNYSSAQRKEMEEEVAATRKDDRQRGGKSANPAKSTAVPNPGATTSKPRQKPASASKNAPVSNKGVKAEDSDSDVPLGARN
ncbi:unnamed protein product [Parajaminaea phylloscopi]